MQFKKIEISDFETLKPFIYVNGEMTCEVNFINLLMWKRLYNNRFCIEDGILYLKSYSESLEIYSLPFGDMKKGFDTIKNQNGGKLPFLWTQDGERFDNFKNLYEEYYDIYESRNEFDYIYASSDLINLSGKKYHSKRNHISAFSKQYDWHYEDITSENAHKIKECAKKWYEQHLLHVDEELKCEINGVSLMLDNMDLLDVKGGAIVVDGEVVAFALGSPINQDVFDIHIEKALKEFDTAYAVINKEFAAHNLENYKYINREDDLGLEGLRKAKLSYKPQIILPKYICMPKE